jgi:ribosome maturation factor RimP
MTPDPSFAPKTFKDRLRDLLEPVVRHYGMELFDLTVVRGTRSAVVRVVIDNPAGELTIDDCERIHRHIELALDTSGLVGMKYSLEVGTPGLDRPLRSAAEFQRFAGRLAKVVFLPGHQPASALGTIAGVEGESISLQAEDGGTVTFTWDEVSRAHLEVEMFRKRKPMGKKKHG